MGAGIEIAASARSSVGKGKPAVSPNRFESETPLLFLPSREGPEGENEDGMGRRRRCCVIVTQGGCADPAARKRCGMNPATTWVQPGPEGPAGNSVVNHFNSQAAAARYANLSSSAVAALRAAPAQPWWSAFGVHAAAEATLPQLLPLL